jgi:hypothetical protein
VSQPLISFAMYHDVDAPFFSSDSSISPLSPDPIIVWHYIRDFHTILV